ncbi:MAG: hypothetical protein ABIG32_02780 [Candidatus Uhrbacteria bacterium]|nr:hypothetical protein [Patescibacteria group bacterium]MBU1906781.1 hypothetical protein [Patescibacteria group bacterium]
MAFFYTISGVLITLVTALMVYSVRISKDEDMVKALLPALFGLLGFILFGALVDQVSRISVI